MNLMGAAFGGPFGRLTDRIDRRYAFAQTLAQSTQSTGRQETLSWTGLVEVRMTEAQQPGS